MDNQEIDKDIAEFIEFERKYYTPGGIMDTVLAVSSAEYAIKYLLMCNAIKDYESLEDAEKLTPELLEEYENIKGSFEDYINAFNYYSVELELFQKAEAEGRAEEIRENFIAFTKEVAAEVKKRF